MEQHTYPWEAATPLADRLLFAKPADEDLEEGTAGAGTSHSDDDEPTDETQDQETDEDAESSDEKETEESEQASVDAEEETYKKRFGDLKNYNDQTLRHAKELMAENARLKAEREDYARRLQPDENEATRIKRLHQEIYSEAAQITDEDPAKRTNQVYGVIAKHLDKVRQQAVQQALALMEQKQQQSVQQTEAQQQNKERAEKRARIVLKEEGLDPDRYLPRLVKIVDAQMDEDPEWFSAIPPDQQFTRMVGRLKQQLAENKGANDEHRKQAGGLGPGAKSRPAGRNATDDDEGESMGAAMLAHRQGLKTRGTQMYKVASTHR